MEGYSIVAIGLMPLTGSVASRCGWLRLWGRCLCDGLPDGACRCLTVGWTHRVRRAPHRQRDDAPPRTLSSADRLESLAQRPFGNVEWLGRYDGINRIPALSVFGLSLASGRKHLVPHSALGVCRLRLRAKPRREPARASDPRAARRGRDGRGNGCRYGLDARRRLLVLGHAHGHFGFPVVNPTLFGLYRMSI